MGTKVAAKEHSEFINYMDLIDGLPPGLYEIVITDKSKGEAGGELLEGDYNVRIEERDLVDLRALGGNSIEDEWEFEAVAHLSEINKGMYATFVQPWIKPLITPQVVAALVALQPLRLGYALCSDKNPLMRGVATLAENVCAERKAVSTDNPFLRVQEQFSNLATAWFQTWGDLRDQTAEAIFHAIYGSPWIQGLLGVTRDNARPRPKPGISPDHEAVLAAKIEEVRTTMTEGGPLEAASARFALHSGRTTQHRCPHI